jgi:hypothetical protein
VLDMARRPYRFLWNKPLSSETLQAGLYAIRQATVEHHGIQDMVVAIDPVNFEKSYTHKLEGVPKRVFHKSISQEAFSGHNGQTRESDRQTRKLDGQILKGDPHNVCLRSAISS